MDVHEARQWELPVVFVCGLVEGQFPRRASTDPLLGDELRLQLQAQGFPMPTSADRDREETFLCEFAQTRATSRLTLTHPLFTSDGKPALRAFALDAFEANPEPARPMRIAASSATNAAARYSLQAAEVLDSIRATNATFRPTWLEDYLQCPFRFFSRRTLRLREGPAGPEERLNPATLGTVIHRAIERWHGGGGNLLVILESEWRRELARLRIPATWRTETQWLLLERSARFYMVKGLPEPGWDVTTEVPLSLTIDGFRFEGRADRIDRDSANHARVLEFKFVGATGLKKRKGKVEGGLAVQAPLYALALEQRGLEPMAYSIVGLRGDTAMATYDTPAEVQAGMALAAQKASAAAFQITQGDIRVMPADEEMCGSCSYQHACRKREDRAAPAAPAGGESPE
jgi:ATP-dependent helicase/DNAse subunit B